MIGAWDRPVFAAGYALAIVALLCSPYATPCLCGEPNDANEQVDFSRDVIPLLTRAGCNTGACHGAAAGRGYLRLSLFGSRPRDDFESLVHSMRGGLVDLARPSDSLLLLKPTEQIEHGGGTRLADGSRALHFLTQWIQQGAAPGGLQPVTEIHLFPSEQLTFPVGSKHRVTVAARWLESEATEVVPADAISVVGASESGDKNLSSPLTFLRRGEELEFTGHKVGYWPVTIRVGGVAKSLAIWVSPHDLAANVLPEAEEKRGVAAAEIDRISAKHSRKLGMTPAATCSSAELARRLWIDLLQRHPSKQEWKNATEQLARGEKLALVDQLLSSREFSIAAAERMTGWFKNASTQKQKASASQLSTAIADRLERDDNLRKLCRDMLTVPAQGAVGPLGEFHRLASGPRERTELVAGTLMGVQMGCAKCHDHPLDKWTQDDYFAMAACWAPVQSDAKVRRIDGRTTTDLRTEQAAVAELPDGESIASGELADHALIDWLLADGNPYFARNLANRTWEWLIGDGLVSPVDDFRSTNPAVAPELLDYLSNQLRRDGYSLRAIVRRIVLSESYSRLSNHDAVDLVVRLGAERRPKKITIPIERLAQQFFGIEDVRPVTTTEAAPMMTADKGSCTRAAACQDPLSEGLRLVSGSALTDIIRRGVEKSWRRPDITSATELLRDLHQRAFGNQASADTQASWRESILEYAGDMPEAGPSLGREFAEQEVVEAIVWGWIVSDKFRSLH